jgi:hypothetical protein
VGQDPDDDFKRHEPDDQQERDRQVPPVRVGTDVRRMATPAVMMVGVLVIGLAVFTAHIQILPFDPRPLRHKGHDARPLGAFPAASVEVHADDIEELLPGVAWLSVCMASMVDDVKAHVIFEDLCQQPVDCASARRDALQDGCTVQFVGESSLHGLDLPADAADTMNQLLLVPESVRHEQLR